MGSKRLAKALAVLLLVAACHVESGYDEIIADGFHVVGDSTMVGVEHMNGHHGSTGSGLGYTEGAPNGTIELTPPEQDLVVASLSLWDLNSQSLQGYVDAHNYYESFGVPVVWVALPPSPGHVEDPTAFNDTVANLLGCPLIPYEIRQASTLDGIHYDAFGGVTVTERLGGLTAEDAC